MIAADTAATVARVREMGAAIIELADAMAHAEQVQWLVPPAPPAAQTDARPPAGGIRRPTEETATGARRLRIRAALISAELEAQRIAATATASAAELRDAVTAWAGCRA